MIDWTEIDFQMPLPLGEVIATDGTTYLTGHLERISFSRVYCRGNFEELNAITHYSELNKPKQLVIQPKEQFSSRPYVTDEAILNSINRFRVKPPEEEAAVKEKIEKFEKDDYYVNDGPKKLGRTGNNWLRLTEFLRSLPMNEKQSSSRLSDFMGPNSNLANYKSLLKAAGYIEYAGKATYAVVKEIPKDAVIANLKMETNWSRLPQDDSKVNHWKTFTDHIRTLPLNEEQGAWTLREILPKTSQRLISQYLFFLNHSGYIERRPGKTFVVLKEVPSDVKATIREEATNQETINLPEEKDVINYNPGNFNNNPADYHSSEDLSRNDNIM